MSSDSRKIIHISYVLEEPKWDKKAEIMFYWHGFKIFKIWNNPHNCHLYIIIIIIIL